MTEKTETTYAGLLTDRAKLIATGKPYKLVSAGEGLIVEVFRGKFTAKVQREKRVDGKRKTKRFLLGHIESEADLKRFRRAAKRFATPADAFLPKEAPKASLPTLAALVKPFETAKMKATNERTKESFRYSIRLLPWKDIPVDRLAEEGWTWEEMAAWHADKPERRAANLAIASARRIWRWAPMLKGVFDPHTVFDLHKITLDEEPNAVPVDEYPGALRRIDAMDVDSKGVFWRLVSASGIRKAEALAAQWQDLDLDAGMLTIPSPKGGVTRKYTRPIGPSLATFLRDLKARPLSDRWLCPAARGDGHLTDVDVPGWTYTPHQFRFSYLSKLRSIGIEKDIGSLLLNHRLPRGSNITTRYSDPNDLREVLREAVNRVDTLLTQLRSVG
ncbi:MAG: hypothetical protein U1E46_09615 [Hyphomicrobiales bacterium]